ncbi:lipase-like protein 3 [Elsinoe australis]|uniref:Lipase-like protein 3 n=1 Tax=Elsinoe australis TaxID=40998 RepID=A0A4U7B2C8_9PEZI|nr:lipase-like protein 3 [Elsinoe australis]
MRFLLCLLPFLPLALSSNPQIPLLTPTTSNTTISAALFNTLEEHSRLVDITYCINPTNLGLTKPFTCLSRCTDFPTLKLITTWNTGPLLTDSCGYIALDHSSLHPRIVVAFRGTYSLANTVLDLATVRQEYVPYPAADNDDVEADKCEDCAAHMGFLKAWRLTSDIVMPHLLALRATHPTYELVLIGHSLGGAVAAFAALEMEGRGWRPSVTTFGEPRVGNEALSGYFDRRFGLGSGSGCAAEAEMKEKVRYRRVTHVDDPVPLLPLSEWGYAPHSGEIFITKSELSPEVKDLRHCCGSADKECIAGQDESLAAILKKPVDDEPEMTLADSVEAMAHQNRAGFGFPSRFKLWQLLFAHRDYFWRLGLCVPSLHPEL